MNSVRCVILGGGGHARVLLDTLSANKKVCVEGILDKGKEHGDVGGIPVLGSDDLIPGLVAGGVSHFVIGMGSVKMTDRRQALYKLAANAGLTPLVVIAASAEVSTRAEIGYGAQILFRAVVNAGARVGLNTIVNTGAIIEHDCCVEDHVHIATGAILCGDAHIGFQTHVGAGAIVKQGIRIGSRCTIGAGAVVVRDVADGECVAGVPARRIDQR
jgi:sugar O-acyltransferase (sialic acid O-acetyltransferase NeuD family)